MWLLLGYVGARATGAVFDQNLKSFSRREFPMFKAREGAFPAGKARNDRRSEACSCLEEPLDRRQGLLRQRLREFYACQVDGSRLHGAEIR
jgi:hypothetical protein